MEEILRISDEVTVMRDGKHIATKPANKLTTDEIIRLMVGRELKNRYPEKTNTPGETFLTVNGLSASIKSSTMFLLQQGAVKYWA